MCARSRPGAQRVLARSGAQLWLRLEASADNLVNMRLLCLSLV